MVETKVEDAQRNQMGTSSLRLVESTLRGVLEDFFKVAHTIYTPSMLITALCLRTPAKARLYPKRITLPDGTKLCLNNSATFHINVPDIYYRREYFLHKDYIPKTGWTVIDVGAYVGIFSIYVSKIVGDEGLVIAFEPDPITYQCFVRNLNLNRSKNIVTLPIALGKIDGRMKFYSVTKGNTGRSSFLADNVNNAPQEVSEFKTLQVSLRSLDGLLPTILSRYKKGYIDLMKIDVEGYEEEVLEGTTEAFGKGIIKRLVVEVHLNTVRHGSIASLLSNLGFSIENVVIYNNVKEIVYSKSKNIANAGNQNLT